MCALIELADGKYVAEIKHKYIENIIKQAANCKNIRRIICILRPLCTRNPRSGYRESNKAVPTIRYCSTAS